MKKRKYILLAVLVVVVIGGLAWVVLREPRQPIYNGKTLMQWLAIYLKQLEHSDTNEVVRVDDAIRHIGTNALPTLLRLTAAHDSPNKVKFFALLQKQKIIKIVYVDDFEQNLMGTYGLHALGPDAKPAVPDLIKIYHQSDSLAAKLDIISVLARIGPGAKDTVPFLIHEATNDNLVIGIKAVEALGTMRSEPEVIVPALINLMQQTNRIGDCHDVDAIQALEKFGPDARLAIPELIRALTNGNPDVDINVRHDLIHALKAIDPAVAAKFKE